MRFIRTVLERADHCLTAVEDCVGVLGKRHAWHLGEAIKRGSMGLREILWMLNQSFGWVTVDPDVLLNAQKMSAEGNPQYPSPGVETKEVAERVRQLMRGRGPLRSGRVLPLETLSWRCCLLEADGALSQFHFHALEWIKELIAAYRLACQVEYLDRACLVAERWIGECLGKEHPAIIWDDHITAMRALILCQLWEECRSKEPPGSPFLVALFSAMVRHAEKLIREPFYRPDHNHGVTQAYALLAVGVLLRPHPQSEEWVQKGRARLETQMEQNVSSEGCHREHSPYYHFFVFRQFFYAYLFAGAHGVSFSRQFADRLEAMLRCGAYFLKPNGSLTAFGDTSYASPVLVERPDMERWPFAPSENFLYSSSRGQIGKRPNLSSASFPGGGYVFFRSGWGETEAFADEIFLALRTANFQTTHIHRDLFSFELYAYGNDLIVDSGGPFNYTHPMRKDYFLTTAAHNTVAVDYQDQNVGTTQILRWHTSDDYDLFDAQHTAYPGIIHRRIVIFVRSGYFILLDYLKGADFHHYSQLFHLAPDLQAKTDGVSVSTTHAQGGAILSILPLGKEHLEIILHKGAMSPPQGWICLGEGKLVPNEVVEYRQIGKSATFATLFVPSRDRTGPQISSEMRGKLFRDETMIRVDINGASDEILFSPAGIATMKRELYLS